MTCAALLEGSDLVVFLGYRKLPIAAVAIAPGAGFLIQFAHVRGLTGIGADVLRVSEVAPHLLEPQTISCNCHIA